uniref:Uncharacterized protein n=1 Tax=Piliocolobus tephrosceles TaxID=591936 RepID=A0A8C9GGK5_9PRIM
VPLLPGLCPVCRHYGHMALPELQPARRFAPSQPPRQQSLLATVSTRIFFCCINLMIFFVLGNTASGETHNSF